MPTEFSHETQRCTSETGPRHRAPHRAAAESGDGAAAARAHRDDDAEGEGAAAVRRAADHDRQARRRRPATRTARRCTLAAWCWRSFRTRTSSASCSTRSRRGSRSGRAATRASCASASAAAIPRRSRRSSSSAASTTAEGRPTDGREKEAPKKTKGVGDRLRQAAQRMRGGKRRGRLEGAGQGPDPGRARRPRRRARPAAPERLHKWLKSDGADGLGSSRCLRAGPSISTCALQTSSATS